MAGSLTLSTRVVNESARWTGVFLARMVRKLLGHVPPSDLVDLDSIIIRDRVVTRSGRNQLALYTGRYERTPAYIELSMNEFARRWGSLFLFVPYFGKFIVASILYHEIGHHSRNDTHGLGDEESANRYRDRILTKALSRWLRILSSFTPLTRRLARVLGRYRSRPR